MMKIVLILTRNVQSNVFCTTELPASLEKGHVILNTYEICEVEMIEGLFKSYVNTFLKMKQEASGFPEGFATDQQKHQYIRN